MKIKEFLITRYGPLKEWGKISLGNFNLFFGRNEVGKTLLIDAILKVLLGKESKDFEKINRVEESPEGYVVLGDEEGKEYKLPEKRDAVESLKSITSSEFRNIFIIRNSDLSIKNEDKFYVDTTEKLTGIMIREIGKIKEKIKEIGRLTPDTLTLSDDKKYGKISSKVKKVKELIGKIEALKNEDQRRNFGRMMIECVELEDRINYLRGQKRKIHIVKKREAYEKGLSALEELKKLLKIWGEVEGFTEEEMERWKEGEGEAKRWNEEREGCERELREKKERLKDVEEVFENVDEKREKLKGVREALKKYETKEKGLNEKKRKTAFLLPSLIFSIFVFLLSLLGIVLRPSFIFYVLIGISLISSSVLVFFIYRLRKEEKILKDEFDGLKEMFSKFVIEAQTIEGIHFNLEKFEGEYIEKKKEMEMIKVEKENLEKRIRDLEGKIKSMSEEIERIKERAKVFSLEEYRKKVNEKQKIRESMREKELTLEHLFGKTISFQDDNLSYWEERIRELEEYKDKERDKKYDQKEEERVEMEIKEGERKQEEMRKKVEDFQKRVERVLDFAKEVLKDLRVIEGLKVVAEIVEPSPFGGIEELERVKEGFIKFKEEVERNAEIAMKAIEIFDKIEEEERKKISELFGIESPVSQIFREITDGLYEEVLFNESKRKIEVKKKDGSRLEAEKLSAGAYDQLYFSIRLALGEKILKGDKGFFILDDPFIKSDSKRLKRQIEMLRKISNSGWQILYFSAKEEIKEFLEEDCKEGFCQYFELKG